MQSIIDDDEEYLNNKIILTTFQCTINATTLIISKRYEVLAIVKRKAGEKTVLVYFNMLSVTLNLHSVLD